ncbi:phenylpropionate dioxygenase-like ring-hydroxylating dioxygenase large terminal subunit [Rhodoligotrophos appendicifer]|uniref:aromatic ring-hydroxylating oxygenase subunit alpha n=1 Tax=Rhodoligotrophos appendicifer TaxID=987056 RepID=UPI0019614C19|nr:SRPBCC family protein [Rhodoligotrophos appendicifer]
MPDHRLSSEAATLLADLRRYAAEPLDATRTTPPAAYNSQEIYDLEMRQIFGKGWVCPGFAADIPNTGDYITYSIVDQPVFVIRDRDGAIRTFSNVCLHRMMILLEGSGSTRKIMCPYHAWTYDLDGALIGAGHMQKTTGFDRKEYCLPEIRTEIWNGWIYITLNPDAPSISEELAPLDPLLARYGMASYVPVIHQDQVWQTNWKLLTENFMEGYHGPVAHKATVGAGIKLEETRFPEERRTAFTYSTFTKPEGAPYGTAHPDNRRLEGLWRRTALMPTIFPSHMFSCSPDYLWHLSLRPKGPGEVQVRVGVALAPENYAAINDLDAHLAPLIQFFDQVNAEDRIVVEGIYKGSLAPLASSGPLSWLEREIHDFMGYLAKALEPELEQGSPKS